MDFAISPHLFRGSPPSYFPLFFEESPLLLFPLLFEERVRVRS
jgi:hypothetical protein